MRSRFIRFALCSLADCSASRNIFLPSCSRPEPESIAQIDQALRAEILHAILLGQVYSLANIFSCLMVSPASKATLHNCNSVLIVCDLLSFAFANVSACSNCAFASESLFRLLKSAPRWKITSARPSRFPSAW